MKRKNLALGACATGVIGVGLGVLAGSLYHARSYRIHRRSVFVHTETADGKPLRILHLSDMHLLARDTKRIEFLASLSETNPDLVVVTGDFIAEDAAIEPLIDALDALLDLPGAFVFGSNDYFAPTVRNPLAYLTRNSNESDDDPGLPLDTDRLAAMLESRGWLNLTNRRSETRIGPWDISFVGVDDPHAGLDQFATGAPSQSANLRLGVTHAPYLRVLDEMSAEGNDVVFAGHTHGGQVCLPGYRALVTNCDLPPEYASGLFTWPPDGGQAIKTDGAVIAEPGVTAVNVSAGIGTSPYTPVRTFCPPEAIIVDIVPANAKSGA